jgi:hypothetical protein
VWVNPGMIGAGEMVQNSHCQAKLCPKFIYTYCENGMKNLVKDKKPDIKKLIVADMKTNLMP